MPKTVGGEDVGSTAGSGCASILGAVSRPPLHPFPRDAILRRVCPWQRYPLIKDSLLRIAFHEAGHVVMFEWLGVSELRASATPQSGTTDLLEQLPQGDDGATPAQRPDLAATAAAIYHAGTCAEMLAAGNPWRGPVLREGQDDHQRAEALLSAVFGACASGAHAYAQRVALHVLSHRWPRVREVAATLVRDGRYLASTAIRPLP